MNDKVSLCFPPVVDHNTRLLILGSLPGVRSLELSQYYGHPRNHFWPILGELIQESDLSALPYDRRLLRIQAHGIGLWDVVARAVRRGSLDQHIRYAEGNPLAGLIAALPALCAIAFNGATAARIGRKQLDNGKPGNVISPEGRPITLIDLPSTSPANTMALYDKKHRWSVLRDFIF